MPSNAPNEPAHVEPPARPAKVMDSPEDGRLIWSILYGLNTVVPALLATIVVGSLGWLGVSLAILLLVRLGLRILVRHPEMIWPAVVGAVLVGLSQFCPILQIFAGGYAIGLTKWLLSLVVSSDQQSKLGIMGGFLATTFTGLELLTISIVLGRLPRGLLRLLGRIKSWRAETLGLRA